MPFEVLHEFISLALSGCTFLLDILSIYLLSLTLMRCIKLSFFTKINTPAQYFFSEINISVTLKHTCRKDQHVKILSKFSVRVFFAKKQQSISGESF